jgi:hypothetical protein
MIRLRHLFAAAFVAAALATFIPQHAAHAAQTVMCAPNPIEGANNRTIGAGIAGTGIPSPVPSGSTYTLNGQGCAVIQQADVGYFLSLGFSAGPPFGANILTTTGVQTGTTSVLIGTLPPSTYIQHIIVNNLTAQAVTGNITFGSTSGGTDIVPSTGVVCGANCLTFTLDSQLAKRVFSTTASTPIFAQAITSWNSANVTITVVFGYF